MVEREIEGYIVSATLHESKLSVEFWVADNHHDEMPHIMGYIKWDGCSNWDFPLPPNVTHPIHFCTLDDVDRLHNLFLKLYEWAAELMPTQEILQKLKDKK